MAMYSKTSYWNQRYSANANEPHEWYQNYKGLRHLLNPTSFSAQCNNDVATTEAPTSIASNSNNNATPFPPRDQCRVLILGCGNSTFGEDMMRDGWTGPIVNVDFSATVIEQMKIKYDDAFYESLGKNVNKMEYICADVLDGLQFSDESFDLIVCKGAFDAILCSAGSVANIRTAMEECVRLLGATGVFFLVTHGNPDSRIVFLEYKNDLNYYWEGVKTQTVPRAMTQKLDYVYVCRRRFTLPGRLRAAKEGQVSTENDESCLAVSQHPTKVSP